MQKSKLHQNDMPKFGEIETLHVNKTRLVNQETNFSKYSFTFCFEDYNYM